MSRQKYLWFGILCSLLITGLAVSCASEDKPQTEPETVPPSNFDAERALTAVQARAPFLPCSGEVTHRIVAASHYVDAKFDYVFSSCRVEDAGWSASNDVVDPDRWAVHFGGYDQSQISHLWSASDRVNARKQLGTVSLAYWVWHWNRASGEVSLIRVDWPAAGLSVCGVDPSC